MSLRAKLILSFVVASLGGMFFFSYVAYDISVVSGVKRERAILQEFSQSLLSQFSSAMETPSLAQLKRAIPGRGGKRIVILLTGQNGDILFTEPPLHQLETDFRNFIIPNILQEKDVKGYLVHNGMFYTWIETPIPNTPYSTLVIHTVPDKELASFFKTLLSTPLVIATLIVFWVALWGALIIASLFDKVGKQQSLLEHQALYDNLTGLPNRALFDDRLRQAILIGRRDKQPFALIAMDLDRFKEINDSLGHHAGDRVLQHVAECARASLRDSDTVARMGGDEFTVLLATANNIDGALAVAQKILKALEAPL